MFAVIADHKHKEVLLQSTKEHFPNMVEPEVLASNVLKDISWRTPLWGYSLFILLRF